MKYVSLFAILCPVAFVLYLAVRSLLINLKRKYRVGELRHHVINMIMDPAGCGGAMAHHDIAIHIMRHYDVTLVDVGIDLVQYGFKYGDEEVWLMRQTKDSIARADKRRKEAEAEALREGVLKQQNTSKEVNLWEIKHPAHI